MAHQASQLSFFQKRAVVGLVVFVGGSIVFLLGFFAASITTPINTDTGQNSFFSATDSDTQKTYTGVILEINEEKLAIRTDAALMGSEEEKTFKIAPAKSLFVERAFINPETNDVRIEDAALDEIQAGARVNVTVSRLRANRDPVVTNITIEIVENSV